MSQSCGTSGSSWVKRRGETRLWAVDVEEEACQAATGSLTVGKDRPCANPRRGQGSETAGWGEAAAQTGYRLFIPLSGWLSSLGESSYSDSFYNSSQCFQDLIMR